LYLFVIVFRPVIYTEQIIRKNSFQNYTSILPFNYAVS